MKGFGCRPMRCASSAGARRASESLSRRNPRETDAELSRGYGDLVFSRAGRNADGARGGIALMARRRNGCPETDHSRGVVLLCWGFSAPKLLGPCSVHACSCRRRRTRLGDMRVHIAVRLRKRSCVVGPECRRWRSAGFMGLLEYFDDDPMATATRTRSEPLSGGRAGIVLRRIIANRSWV